MKQILITGGAGFVGSHLCNAFILLGYDVIVNINFGIFFFKYAMFKHLVSKLPPWLIRI